jgi:hypothetical protein
MRDMPRAYIPLRPAFYHCALDPRNTCAYHHKQYLRAA